MNGEQEDYRPDVEDIPVRRRNDDMARSPAKRREDIYIKLGPRVPFAAGSELSISGRNAFYTGLAIAAIAAALFSGFRADEKHEQILEAIAKFTKAVNANTYVSTLSEVQKQQLDLMEPPEITELRRVRELQRQLMQKEMK